jgi:hypothetical protein
MTKPNQLSIARQLLAQTIAKSEPRTPWSLDISPWIAMSLLQKAIRRGHEDLALHAASTLLENSPERLRRRCGGIAFEDIGLADVETLSLVTAALAGKRFRETIGGEWPVASLIVSRMAQAPKCRAADDLLMSSELHPAYQPIRDQIASSRTQELLDIVIGAGDLLERAIALWYAIGTDRRPSRHLHPRGGNPSRVFDLLRESGYRGDQAGNRRRRTYGMCWSANRDVADSFAQRPSCRGHELGSVLLETFAEPEAIICAVHAAADRYGEGEYLLDRRKLRQVRVLVRYPHQSQKMDPKLG